MYDMLTSNELRTLHNITYGAVMRLCDVGEDLMDQLLATKMFSPEYAPLDARSRITSAAMHEQAELHRGIGLELARRGLILEACHRGDIAAQNPPMTDAEFDQYAVIDAGARLDDGISPGE
jgi:hypothetical protein